MPDRDVHPFGDFELTVVVTDPPYFENCYVVRHVPSGAVAVVDPGSAAKDVLAAAGGAGGTAEAVLLTHGHPDHLGALADVQRALGVPCRAHREERSTIEAAPQFAAAMMGESVDLPERIDYFEGEPVLDLGDGAVRVIHTPGHTPGGVCYDFGTFVLTGDTLFNQGVGRTDFPGGDGPQLAASISRLLDILDDGAVLFSGHGPHWTAGEARRWWRSIF